MLKNNPTIQSSFVNNHINYQFSQNKEIISILDTPLYIAVLESPLEPAVL